MHRFFGSLIVIIVIITCAFFWNFFNTSTPVRQHTNTVFEIDSIQPKTPQDYILLGQKIDINVASAETLEALPGIGPSIAERIIRYRASHRRFANIDELDNVPGIGPKLLERIRPFLSQF